MKQKTRLLIVDDHFVVRIGLSGSINVEPDMEVVADASNAAQAINLYKQHRPDVVLMDLRLPGGSGVEAVHAICTEFPEANILIISTYDVEEDIYLALAAGARGYLLKTVLRDELLAAIRTVALGQRYLPGPVANRLAEKMMREPLSRREREVLEKIAQGMSNKEIAAALSLSEVTVKLHVSNLFGKLHVQDRTQAVTCALRRGLVHLD
jgi:two-component system NarL family response regulator